MSGSSRRVLVPIAASIVCGACASGAGEREQAAAAMSPVDSARLADLTGWYDLPDLGSTLVTWGAEAPLTLFALTDTILAARLFRAGPDTFRWGAGGESTVAFERGSRGSNLVRVEGGRRVTALRLEEAPYEAHPIAYTSGGVRLRGTLFEPRDSHRRAGVVMVHGSGASTRDNSWYMQIVHALATSGVAVLFPDKRGSGGSEGDWESAGLDHLTADALAGISALRARHGVDGAPVGLVGISQGGRVAAMAAARSDLVSFVIAVSAAAVPLDEQLEHETTQDLRRSRWPGFLHPLIAWVTLYTVKEDRPDWWRQNGPLDPIDAWQNVRVPALIVYGADDEMDNVPVERSVSRLRALEQPNLEIRVYDRSGHALYEPGTSNRIRADFLAQLVRWIPSSGTG